MWVIFLFKKAKCVCLEYLIPDMGKPYNIPRVNSQSFRNLDHIE